VVCARAALSAPVLNPAGAVPGTIDVPATVSAGEVVELRWQGIPGEIDEMELLLSLDGGCTYPVRVTPELEGHSLTFRWSVPDLPTGSAQLLLRVGDGEGERLGARSRTFRILHVAGAPSPDLGFHEGSLWTGAEPAAGAGPSSIAPADQGYASGMEPLPSGAPGPAPPRATWLASRRLPVAAAVAAPALRRFRDAAAPREVPLRS
jgi:hypothetical protein